MADEKMLKEEQSEKVTGGKECPGGNGRVRRPAAARPRGLAEISPGDTPGSALVQGEITLADFLPKPEENNSLQ